MTGRVVEISLLGLSDEEALSSVDDLLSDRSLADLSRPLVIDDTTALARRADVLDRLLTSGRLNHLVCLAVGPSAERGRLRIPGAISAGRDSAVLWIGDRIGVDWPAASSAVALLRPEDGPDGLRQLVETLSAADVYDRVRDLFRAVPNGVACPGIRIAEPATGMTGFATTLAIVIDRLAEPRIAAAGEQPFSELLSGAAASSPLAERGELARARSQVVAAAEQAAGALDELSALAGLLTASRSARDARDLVVTAGERLAGLRCLVVRLLEEGHAPGGLSPQQRSRLARAGLSLPEHVPDRADLRDMPRFSSAIRAAIGSSLREGDGLGKISDRLAATERSVQQQGSRSCLPRVDRSCPPSLADRLRTPPPFPAAPWWTPVAGAGAAALASTAGVAGAAVAVFTWIALIALTTYRPPLRTGGYRSSLGLSALGAVIGGAAGLSAMTALAPGPAMELGGPVLAVATIITALVLSWRARARAWRRSLAPGEAGAAAESLVSLMTEVADREWSADPALPETLARARIAVDGIRDELVKRSGELRDAEGNGRSLGHRLERLLSSVLLDLVMTALGGQPVLGRGDGTADYQLARDRTGELLTAWIEHAALHGPAAMPPFSGDAELLPSPAPADQEAIRAAAGHDPHDVMWQLCLPSDLAMLDVGEPILSVPFAPEACRTALASFLPPDTKWTSTGHAAGLLRLLPLRLAVIPIWSADESREQP